jgi:hypothetical protein
MIFGKSQRRDGPKVKMYSKATGYEGVYCTDLMPQFGWSIKPSGLIKCGYSFTNGTKITFSRLSSMVLAI